MRGRCQQYQSIPVNQIVSRGLGEAVKGAIHRVHAICTAYSRWRRLERRSIASLMTLIMLYDVGAYVAMLAHGGLPARLAMADGHVSR